MHRSFLLLWLPLLVVACTPTQARHSQVCYAATPYDYSNLPPQSSEGVPYVRSYGNCPAAVTDLLMRDERCTQWYGEQKFLREHPRQATDARRRQSTSMMQHFRCDQVADDIARMKQQYLHDANIVRALDNAGIGRVI